MKRSIFLLLCSLLTIGGTWAQTPRTAIRGILLRSSDRTPVEFANVLLRSPKDSTMVAGAVTDSLGAFHLPVSAGDYLLEVRALGYEPFLKSLTLREGTLDLGGLLLREDAQELKAVEVTAKRPIISRRADRLVFDAEQLALGAQNALDVLKKTPGLHVTDEAISIIGRGKVIVLINDKRVRLSGKALVDLLRSYTQEDIAEVQVITTPPAKYEAEGNAGILNIVLKRAKNDYLGGSASLGYGLERGQSSYNASTNLNYQQGKVSASLTLNGSTYDYKSNFDTYKTYPSTALYSESLSQMKLKSKDYGIRGGLDYAFTPELTMGVTASYTPEWKKLTLTDITKNYKMLPSGGREQLLGVPSQGLEDNYVGYSSLNLHLEKTFASAPGRKISWDADYVGYTSSGDHDFASVSETPQGHRLPDLDFAYTSATRQRTRSYLTNVDLTLPLGKTILSMGAKGTWTRTDNRNTYHRHTTLGKRDDATLFDEHVYALYADVTQPLSEQWELRGGLRMEYTHAAGESKGQARLNLRDYVNFFPTVYLGYNPSERHAFNLEGTVRLDRPHFSQLSPYPFYENRYLLVMGKEDLRASKRGSVTLGYTFGGKLNFQATGSYLWDGIAAVLTLDPKTNEARYQTDNAETQYSFGLENSYHFTSLSFLQCYVQQSLYYTSSNLAQQGQTRSENKGFSYSASLNGTVFFNPSKTFTGTFFLAYLSPQVANGGRISSMCFTGVGLSYALLEGKLRLTTNLNNLIRTDSHFTMVSEGNKIEVVNYMPLRTFDVGVSYSFGASLSSKELSKNAKALRSRM